MNNTPKMHDTVSTETVTRKELVDVALRATDAYLGIEKEANKRGFATMQDVQEFVFQIRVAHDALVKLNDIHNHLEYMNRHIDNMIALSPNEGDDTLNVTRDDMHEERDPEIHSQAKETIRIKSDRHNVDQDDLEDVYKRGVKAQKDGRLPHISAHQAGLARVDYYLDNKEKTLGESLTEAKKESKAKDSEVPFDAEDLEKDVKNLDWHDIVDLYDEEELVKENEKENKKKIDEALSAAERIKKRATFARYAGKREAAKKIKLRRASDMGVLKKRAKLAARRLLLKRLLRGRNKSDLSADEKNRIEGILSKMGNLQTTLANKLVPRIREIEKSRLSSNSKK